MIRVGFLYPVIDNIIYVGQRGTPPHQGLYGPIGGKCEKFSEEQQPLTKEALGGGEVPCVECEVAEKLGFEYSHGAAIREFFEEAFQESLPITLARDIFYIGGIDDWYKEKDQDCMFYMARTDNRNFNPSPRELKSIKPLLDTAPVDLFPLAKVSLYGLKYLLKGPFCILPRLRPYKDVMQHLAEQIPDFDEQEIARIMAGRRSSIMGALVCHEKFLRKVTSAEELEELLVGDNPEFRKALDEKREREKQK